MPLLAGAGGAGGEEAGGEAPAHRVLVFAQLRALLDLVETEVKTFRVSDLECVAF